MGCFCNQHNYLLKTFLKRLLLYRSITLRGNIQKFSSGQYFLSLPDNSLWTLRPKTNNIDLTDNINKQVMVKGNLTAENNVIEVKEMIYFEKLIPMYNPPATHSGIFTA